MKMEHVQPGMSRRGATGRWSCVLIVATAVLGSCSTDRSDDRRAGRPAEDRGQLDGGIQEPADPAAITDAMVKRVASLKTAEFEVQVIDARNPRSDPLRSYTFTTSLGRRDAPPSSPLRSRAERGREILRITYRWKNCLGQLWPYEVLQSQDIYSICKGGIPIRIERHPNERQALEHALRWLKAEVRQRASRYVEDARAGRGRG